MKVASLEIEMLANLARLQKDMSEAKSMVGGAMGQIEKMVGGAKSALAALGLGLSIGAFASWIKGAIDAADSTSKLAQKIGVATKDVAGLELAYQQAGLGGDALTTSMSRLSKGIVEGNIALKALGIQSKDATGNFKSTTGVLYEVADAFKGMPDGAQKAALAVELFGKSGADMIPLLNGGSQGLREMAEMAEKLGLTIDEKTAKQAEQFNDTIDLVKQGTQGVARGIAAQLLPTLTSLAGSFLESMTSGDKLKRTADVLGTGLKILYSVALGIIEAFSTVGKVLGGVSGAIVAVLKGDFGDAKNILSAMKDDIGAGWQDTAKAIARAWSTEGNAAIETQVKILKGNGDLLQATKDREAASKKAAEAAKREAEIATLLWKDYEKMIGARTSDIDRLKKQVAEQDDYNEKIGLTKEQIAKLDIKKAEEMATSLQRLAVLEDEKGTTSRLSVLYREQAELLQALADKKRAGGAKETAVDEAKKVAEEWQKTADSINESLTDALMRGFESGKDFAANFKETLINMFKTLILRPVISAILSPVSAGISTMLAPLTGGIAGAGGGIGGISSIGSFFGGSSIGQGIANTAAQISGVAGGVGPAAPGTVGSLFSGAGQYGNLAYGAAGLLGGLAGGALFGNKGYSSAGGSLGSTLGMAIGGPIGAILGTIAGSALGSLLGDDGPEKNTNISFGNTRGRQAIKTRPLVDTAFGQYGVTGDFWSGDTFLNPDFRKNLDSYLTSVKFADAAFAKSLSAAEVAMVTEAVAGKSKAFGAGEEHTDPAKFGTYAEAFQHHIKQVLEAVDSSLSDLVDGFSGSAAELADEAANILSIRKQISEGAFDKIFGEKVTFADIVGFKVEAINDQLQASQSLSAETESLRQSFLAAGLSIEQVNQIVATGATQSVETTALLTARIGDLRKEGESTAQAFQRLVSEFQVTNFAAELVGKSAQEAFGAVGLASREARERLIDLAGGIDTLNAGLSAYYQSYFTEQERMTRASTELQEQLKGLGVTGVTTKEQFRAVVEGIDLTTESGANLFAKLMQIAPAFAQVAEYFQGVGEAAGGAASQMKGLLEAMKQTVADMDAVSSLTQSIGQSIAGIKQSAPGFDSVGATRAQVTQAWSALNGVAGGSVQQRIAAAESVHNAIMANYQAEINAAQQVHQAQETAAQQAIAAANQLNDAYRKLGDYAQSLLVGNLSVLSPDQKLAQASSQYQTALAAARSGDVNAAQSLQGYAQTYLDQARGYYASNQDYVGIFNAVQSALSGLGSMAGPEQVYQENTAAWQAQLSSIQTGALEQLSGLSKLTEGWQEELKTQLEEQAISFSELELSSEQVAANTKDLDVRIGEQVARAIAAKMEAQTAQLIICLQDQNQVNAKLAEASAQANEKAMETQTAQLKPAPALQDRR